MIRPTLAALLLGAVATLTASCSNDGFGRVRNPARLDVVLASGSVTGSVDAPLPLHVGAPVTFKVSVRALGADGAVDASFSRYVRLSSRPGAIGSLSGAGVEGRNVLVQAGQSVEVEVGLSSTYGTTYIVADDLGYVPADPLRDPRPACANGVDDDGDGAIDFPADSGCAFANDDSEEAGTFGEGTSRPIFFSLPRIADVRGIQCDASGACLGNGRTPYPREPIRLDTGWRQDGTFAFDTVVTRLSSDGFYVSDRGDPRAAFNNIFAFNFNAPPFMRVCDRLKTWGGTANEFFGFTQISYPTWSLEEWDPAKRLCLVPSPESLGFEALTAGEREPTEFLKRSAGLVRVETKGGRTTTVTRKFGPEDMPCRIGNRVETSADKTKCNVNAISKRFEFVNPLLDKDGKECDGTLPDCVLKYPNATNCDFDRNGRINSFVAGDPEGDCSTACSGDAECTEYSNYEARKTFRLTVTEKGKSAAIQADASASAGFDPFLMRGKEIRSFTGTLSFFSGGSQFTVEARCNDDIVLDKVAGPFPDDLPCASTQECIDRRLPVEFTCRELGGSAKGCRKVDPQRPEAMSPPP